MPTNLYVDGDGLHLQTTELGQDSHPFNEDMVRSFPRKLECTERPFVQFQVTLPPFSEWPTGPNSGGNSIYLNLRVTAEQPAGTLFWPGIFIGRRDEVPEWGYRVLQAYSPVARLWDFGPWTFGIGLGEMGKLRFYSRKGHVDLSEGDFAAENDGVADGGFFALAEKVNGLFLALRNPVDSYGQLSPNWIIRSVKTFAATHPPRVLVQRNSNQVLISLSGAYPETPYRLERSFDLSSWSSVGVLQNGDSMSDEFINKQQFYRACGP